MSACPECGAVKSKVSETRTLRNGWTRRRRVCFYGCAHKWYTFEVPIDGLILEEPEENLKEFVGPKLITE